MNIPALRFFAFPRRPSAVRDSACLWFFLLLLLSLAACGQNGTVGQGSLSPHAFARAVSRHSAISAPVPPDRYQSVVQFNLAYGPLPGERLDLCTPWHAPGVHPGVLLIHGGGWQSGDKSFFLAMCKKLATQGFVAATINYRLAPRFTWPAQLVDAQLAVRWLRAHAQQAGLDPRRLCAWGQSAGGHLAVFLGTLATIHPGDEAHLLADQSPAVSCVVDAFGPIDLTAPLGVTARPLVLHLFGGVTLRENRALYRDASPIFAVSSHSAPTLILQGTRDTLVLPGQSRELQAALQDHHVLVDYRSYNGSHSYAGLSPQRVSALQAQVIAFLIARERA
ncbi:MAG TPA: alpha/beta hydrolase [Ktedonobacteraceae bacterium]|nr:alpha/beta hydrolase [Ktedonobacteraceae bacterium]